MNILFLIRSLNYGGAERQLVNVAIGLKNIGHKVSVAVFYDGGPLQKELDEKGVPVVFLEKKSRWDIMSFYVSLRRTIKGIKPDIIHGYTAVPNCVALVSRLFYPSAKIVWGVRASNMDLSKYDWLASVVYKLECFLSRYANLIISNSNAGRDYALSNGFPDGTMTVVHNGIDTEKFICKDAERKKIRQLLNISNNSLVIGCVGRLDPMKGYPVFIEAMAHLASESNQQIFVLLIGNGEKEYSHFLKKKVVELGISNNFHWMPAMKDVARYYNAFDIFVSPSLTEGFPNVIGEAMACGTPCVVTDVGDSAFIVGDCGIVVPPNDSMALAQAIIAMFSQLSNSDNKLSLCARKRIIENFTIDKLVDNTEACLNAVKNT